VERTKIPNQYVRNIGYISLRHQMCNQVKIIWWIIAYISISWVSSAISSVENLLTPLPLGADPEGDFVEAIGRNFTPEQAAKVISDHIKDWRGSLDKD